MRLEPAPGRVADEGVARQRGRRLERLGVVRRGVDLEHGLGLVAEALAHVVGEGPGGGLVASEHDAAADLVGVPACEQRHLRLLAVREDREHVSRQEVAVQVRREPGLRLERRLQHLVGALGPQLGERRGAERARELHALLLALGERTQRQAARAEREVGAAFADRLVEEALSRAARP